ncbi:MAG: NAD-dependent deacylase [Wenzhouxiangella sp.]|nr:MAG: NAD-dependent deacylase [Wenzhouxiangella sp.]
MTLSISVDEALDPGLTSFLKTARSVVVLTGAGVSAESGVPTFRDAQQGFWARHDPMQLATPDGFARDPGLVWDWYQWRRKLIAETSPNAGHRAIAELAGQLPGLVVITQNVDGFHQLAGSRHVLELHGNIQRSICSRTRRDIPASWLDAHPDRSPVPSPHHPQGLARPDVVWFGESLDEKLLGAAFAAAQACDLVIVAGTSGVVHPAASIPAVAVEHGARMIEVNPVQTELSRLADWRLVGPSATWLPRLVESLSK